MAQAGCGPGGPGPATGWRRCCGRCGRATASRRRWNRSSRSSGSAWCPGGERLPAERELAERLGISRVTLREVLKVLQDQGLVESRRGRYGGTFVLPRTDSPGEDELRRRVAAVDIEDVLRFREVLEVGAAGLCATHGLTTGAADRLREALAGDARRTSARLPPAGHPSPPDARRAVRLPFPDRAVRGRPGHGERPAGLHPAARAEPGALAAPAHRPRRGGARRGRGGGARR